MDVVTIILCVGAIALIIFIVKKVIDTFWYYIFMGLGVLIAVLGLIATFNGLFLGLLGIPFGIALTVTAYKNSKGQYINWGGGGGSSGGGSSNSDSPDGSYAISNAVGTFTVYSGLASGDVYHDGDYVSGNTIVVEYKIINVTYNISLSSSEIQGLKDEAHNEICSRVQSRFPNYNVRTKCTDFRQ